MQALVTDDAAGLPRLGDPTLGKVHVDPAGEDEIALCNHTVTVKYNPTMEECHKASASGSTVEIELEEGALTLHVGEELPTDDEEEVGG